MLASQQDAAAAIDADGVAKADLGVVDGAAALRLEHRDDLAVKTNPRRADRQQPHSEKTSQSQRIPLQTLLLSMRVKATTEKSKNY